MAYTIVNGKKQQKENFQAPQQQRVAPQKRVHFKEGYADTSSSGGKKKCPKWLWIVLAILAILILLALLRMWRKKNNNRHTKLTDGGAGSGDFGFRFF